MLEIYVQVIVYGIYIGALYGLAAVGLALIFGVMEILQIAHGSIVMLGGYFAFWLFSDFRIDPILSLPISMIVFFFLGIGLFKIFFSTLVDLSPDDRVKNSMLVAFGLILVADNLTTIAFTGNVRTINPFYSGQSYQVGFVQIPYIGIVTLILGGAMIIALHLFLRKTSAGKIIRATAHSAVFARLVGINTSRAYSIAMGIATALGAAGGVLVCTSSGVDPSIGMDWTLKALLITVLAGTGNVGGVFVCGLFFGVVEAIGSIIIGPYKEIIGLVLFLAVLLWRPQGVFSKQPA
jgi:branched-chain amino acid transport system permease protein